VNLGDGHEDEVKCWCLFLSGDRRSKHYEKEMQI